MSLSDLRLYTLNAGSFAISLTDIDVMLKLVLLIVTIGYTINKWYLMNKNK